MRKIRAGLIGCGNISAIYLENAKKFDGYDIVAVADLDIERARQRAEEFGIPKACSTDELLSDSSIDIVINLTIPAAHEKVALEALKNGKHVYCEKPLAVNREAGKRILDTAFQNGLMVASAPDTFLGGGIQTCKKLIDDGWIGEPLSAVAFMMHHGHEGWHPDPGFYYQQGGGPMFDMGPYYITALIALMGPISRVTASTKTAYSERTIRSQPKYGEKIQVNTPTQINGILEFKRGAVASIITSFDTWHHNLPNIEIYGTEGSIIVPDPDRFGGPVYIRRHNHSDWTEIPLTHGFSENSRGLGIAEMAHAILANKTPRANGEMAYHVLDVMQGFHDAAETGKHYDVSSECKQPSLMPIGIDYHNFTELINR